MRPLILLTLGCLVASVHTRSSGSLSLRVTPRSLEVHGDTVRVSFVVAPAPTSTRALLMFTIDAPTHAISVEKPPASEWEMDTDTDFGRSVASWGFLRPLTAESTSPVLAYSARGLPGIVKYWATPFVPPDTIDLPDVAAPAPHGGGPGNSAADSGLTVGVVAFPQDRSHAGLLSRLHGLVDDVCAAGWVDNQGVCNSLRVKIDHDQTDALLNELSAQRGKHVNETAYFLLAGNVWALPH